MTHEQAITIAQEIIDEPLGDALWDELTMAWEVQGAQAALDGEEEDVLWNSYQEESYRRVKNDPMYDAWVREGCPVGGFNFSRYTTADFGGD